MKSLFHKGSWNIQSRFLMVCLSVSLLSLTLMAAVSFFCSYRMVVRRTSEEVEVNLEMASDLLDHQAQEIERLSRNILSDALITGLLKEAKNTENTKEDPQDLLISQQIQQPQVPRQLPDPQTLQQAENRQKGAPFGAEMNQAITTQLKKMTLNAPYVASIYLFNWDGFGLLYRKSTQATTIKVDLRDYMETDWYKRTIRARGYEQYFLGNVINPREEGDSLYSVSSTKLLLDLTTNESFGFLVINVNADYYSNVFPPTSEAQMGYALADPESGEVGYFSSPKARIRGIQEVIVQDLKRREGLINREKPGEEENQKKPGEQENQQIAVELRSQEDKGTEEIRENQSRTEFSSSCIITTKTNRRTGWRLYHVVRKRYYLESMSFLMLMLLLGLLLLTGLSYVLSWVAARAITRPLKQLGQAMQTVRDTGYPPQGIMFGDDEVGTIGRQFLSLFEETKELTDQVTTVTILQKEAELQALQAQINPHFLYNSLSAIYWLSKSGRSEESAQMSVALSELFKAMISQRGTDYSLISEEMHYIDQYLYIQNVRFNGRIRVIKKIDPVLLQEKILKLILQPVVENAVLHGLEPKVGEWELTITGEKRQEEIIFIISDNGVGIDMRKTDWQGYGLRNVIRRIQLRYGGEYGCHFVSRPGAGTTVRVRIGLWDRQKENEGDA